MTTLLSKLKRHAYSMYVFLFIKKDDQTAFDKIASQAAKRYREKHQQYDYEEFLMPSWKKNTEEIQAIFLTGLPFSFLRNQMLKQTMFAHLPKSATRQQKKLITQKYSTETATSLLHENSAGKPILNDLQYKTSGNSIHHLYHLTKFNKETGVSLGDISSVVEFGGGYGNAAKIFRKINTKVTYTIVDIPVFSHIQFVYLSAVFGPDAVAFFDDSETIVEGKINIVPLHKGYMEKLNTCLNAPDLFMSTWALSETNEATQKMVQSMDYFKCTHLLLAYQKANEMFEYAQNIVNLPEGYVSTFQAETEYLDNNFYLFAKKK